MAAFNDEDEDDTGSNDKDEEPDDLDYYAVLNISRDATEEDIKLAYRGMCIRYHPDKHDGKDRKEIAVKIFSKIQKANEVLGDPQSRAIYDVYGCKGLEAGWEVMERKQTPEEIRAEYERLQKEKEEKLLQQRTNPKGGISVKVNATDLFDPYEDIYSDGATSLPNIDVRGMTIYQSIEAPLTRHDTAILSGTLQVENGNGSGNVGVAVRRIISHQSWGELEVGAGQGATLQLKGFRNLTRKMFGTVSINTELQHSTVGAGLQAMVAHQMGHNTTGYLSWKIGLMSAMTSTIVHNSEHRHVFATLQLSPGHCFGVASYQHKFNADTKAKVSMRYSAFGASFEYGCDHKISAHSRLGATMMVGTTTGVSLKIKLHRYTQSYSFPILLSDVISPSAMFYGTVTPIVLYFMVKQLVVNPYVRQAKKQDLIQQRELNMRRLVEKRKEAEASILLLQDVYSRIVEAETSRHGLVIVNAWYGKLVTSTCSDSVSPQVTDVKVPIQCLVKDSKLFLSEAPKYHLNAFYDPCIGEEKSLKIMYRFRDEMHETVVGDSEPCRIPKQSHRLGAK